MNKLSVLLLFLGTTALAQDALRMNRSTGGKVEISWRGTSPKPDGTIQRPLFEVDGSTDLESWHPVGERMRARLNAPDDELLRLPVEASEPFRFYRLRAFEPRVSQMATNGAAVFGYGEQFQKELERIGQISIGEFERMFGLTNSYLEGLSWNPTTAKFYADFNAKTDFKLNEAELAVFMTNGFVVSERLGAGSYFTYDSFADLFYNVWFKDLPVFVSTDAILQGWHRTYDAMLEEVEETYLHSALERMLANMALQVPTIWTEAGTGPLKESILDVDFYLAVARSLLSTNPIASMLDQEARVAETLTDIRGYRLKAVNLFGECRAVDFSQFLTRGHYRHSARLERYFQCTMWLGRTDFMVAGGMVERCDGERHPVSVRETGAAVVLWDLLQRAGEFERWRQIDRVIESFVGWSDSLGFAQLGGILAGAGIRGAKDVTGVETLERLQQEILAGDLGVQNIRSDYYISPLGPEQMQLPRSFLVLGQRFTPDSWSLSQTVFDSIMWEEGGTRTKVNRRVPSALDVAFAVLGNDQVVPELVRRISNTNAFQAATHAERWRDGLPYQHNLAALRAVMDAQTPAAWESSIYMSWLKTLRQLSIPTTDARYPEAMRTRAWAMKTLNTQLASWTHLRHDNVLYVRHSYSGGAVCFYPYGFVEPRVEFWDSLEGTVNRAAELIGGLNYEGEHTYTEMHLERGTNFILKEIWTTNTVPLTEIRDRQVAHLRQFASTVRTLGELSRKELAQIPFTRTEEQFIEDLIQISGSLPQGSGGVRKYDGWYPRLFYRSLPFLSLHHYMESPEVYFQENYGANAADRVAVDVHTDVPAPGDPGGVLHQGIGTPNLLMIAVDNGPDRMVYAGPVLNHYEFETVGSLRRITDQEWEWILERGDIGLEGVAPPAWTHSYLVPSRRPR